MKENEEKPRFKVTVVGESGVGKTCIISRFINEEYSNDVVTTFNATYASKELEYTDLDNIKIKLDIWDTAGQERFRSLSKLFFKDSNASILVYDCTTKSSFDELKNYWYEQLKEKAPEKVVVAIAANKCDLVDEEVEGLEEEARAFAKDIGAIFKKTSAAKDIGVTELFRTIGYKLLDPNYDIEDENVNITKKSVEQAKRTVTKHVIEKSMKDSKKLEEYQGETEEQQQSKKCCF